MAKLKDLPENLRPYVFHGVNLEYRPNDENAIGDCPWCGREGKFRVLVATGQWRCLLCNTGEGKKSIKGGNATTFIRKLWELCDKNTNDYSELAVNRRLLYPDTLMEWGVVRSFLNNYWMVPGYGADGKLRTLYSYRPVLNSGKKKYQLLPTPTLGHHLHGLNLFDRKKKTVFLCEGPWDGMHWWEILRVSKDGDDGIIPTANPTASLLSESNVLATPGAAVFQEAWALLFSGMNVCLMFDNDHERVHPKTGNKIAPSGYEGMRRATEILSGCDRPPNSIQFLQWGKAGTQYNSKLPDGHDVRDHLTLEM